MNIPNPVNISGIGSIHYVFIGDKAFPLMENLMKPYSQRKIALK